MRILPIGLAAIAFTGASAHAVDFTAVIGPDAVIVSEFDPSDLLSGGFVQLPPS